MTTSEPRALTAALQSPAFVTRGGGLALHVASRHVERWAPEAGAGRLRPLRCLGFVDRLVAPWLESAQRSPAIRLFLQYVSSGAGERTVAPVSWVFPRPWFQDELDWMAAARETTAREAIAGTPAPRMLTTRGTYVQASSSVPSLLHEYVAPSLSVARPTLHASADVYSPLVPFAAAQAAHVMARAVAPLAAAQLSPSLRAVLATTLERAAKAQDRGPTRASLAAPELVTPPAPRPRADEAAEELADRYAEQHAHLAELQQLARIAAEREFAHRAATAVPSETTGQRTAAAAAERLRADERAAHRLHVHAREAAARDARHAVLAPELVTPPAPRPRADEAAEELADRYAEQHAHLAELQQLARIAAEREFAHRAATAVPSETTGQRTAAAAAERLRADERAAHRLHVQAREAAARDARHAVLAPEAVRPAEQVVPRAEVRAPAELAAAVAALSPELAAAVAALSPELSAMVSASIGQRPERAVQAIAELGDALRSIELLARTTASGGAIEPTRGPRLVMPAGLGGLVSTVEATTGERAQRVPALAFLGTPERAPVPAATAPTTALGAANAAVPAALHHVAWSDRWLARFAGARPQSLKLLAAAASPAARVASLAAAAPATVLVAPLFEDRSAEPREQGELGFAVGFKGRDEPLPTLRGGPAPAQPVLRFDDDAETPDDMLAAIAMAATRSRAGAVAAAPTSPVAPARTSEPDRLVARETLADLVAHAAPAAPGAGLSAQLAASPVAPARTSEPDRLVARETLADLVAHAAPAAPGAGLSAQLAASPFAPALRHVVPLGSAPRFDVRALFGAGVSATYLAGLLATPTEHLTLFAPELDLAYVAPRATEAGEGEPHAEPLTTLRSTLLAVDVDSAAGAHAAVTPLAATARQLPRGMVESLARPMLGDMAAFGEPATLAMPGTSARAGSYAAPGMIADRAHAWSVAQERSSADLAYDFVPPELVLAARVYGLGPAAAAQAARLAIAGAGQLTAMASAVDRTFVQAIAIESERRGERGRVVTAYPISADAAPAEADAFAPATSAFGVSRRAPRGAFLWPAATTAALGLSAPTPDGDHAMSVAALELLAAQAVAELGTYAALADGVRSDAARAETGKPRDEDVLARASALVPAARRDKLEALYVALGQATAARMWSPAARAARALALAGRGDETLDARERASLAWDVLPVVYAGGADDDRSLSTGEAAARTVRRREELRALDPIFVDARPGLGVLSARAGEALGAYVAPSAPAAAPASASAPAREVGAVLRAPTAAPELVQTGRPAGRYGGGEVEIPAWFEAAARKMFEEKSGGSLADGISLAELTLISTAPAAQIAASTREHGSAPPVVAAPTAAPSTAAHVDIEKLANDVYREVLVLMDLARARNGEPYL